MPDSATVSSPVTLAQAESDMVEACGRFAQSLGLARSVGEIYGLLYMALEPMNFEEIAKALSLSKASVSTGTRQLMALGCIHKVWRRDERKDYFEDEHSRELQEGGSFLGGMTTVLFMVWAYSLLGLTAFFFSYGLGPSGNVPLALTLIAVYQVLKTTAAGNGATGQCDGTDLHSLGHPKSS